MDFIEKATLTGHLYYDLDGNGTQTTGEQNMPGVFVTLTNTNGFTSTVTTNSNGNWIAQVPSGKCYWNNRCVKRKFSCWCYRKQKVQILLTLLP